MLCCYRPGRTDEAIIFKVFFGIEEKMLLDLRSTLMAFLGMSEREADSFVRTRADLRSLKYNHLGCCGNVNLMV